MGSSPLGEYPRMGTSRDSTLLGMCLKWVTVPAHPWRHLSRLRNYPNDGAALA